jgi:hypothetical protein
LVFALYTKPKRSRRIKIIWLRLKEFGNILEERQHFVLIKKHQVIIMVTQVGRKGLCPSLWLLISLSETEFLVSLHIYEGGMVPFPLT